MAFRLPRYANQGAKIEKCGVENRGSGFWEKRSLHVAKVSLAHASRSIDSCRLKSLQNADGVSLHDGNRLIEGKAGYCVRGGSPNSGKLHITQSPAGGFRHVDP